MTIFWYWTRFGGNILSNSAEWVNCLLPERSFHNWEKISHGGKRLQRVIPLWTHTFLFQDPLSVIFRARNERRKTRREGNGQEAGVGHYEGSELVNRTELYFRHPVAHVSHPDPTQITLSPEIWHTVTLRAVVTSRALRTVSRSGVKDSCHASALRVDVTFVVLRATVMLRH
jgi:hypothetical protein